MDHIQLTNVIQPAVGAILMAHCPVCRTTVITNNEYALKPEDGDLWFMPDVCLDHPEHFRWMRHPYKDTLSSPAFNPFAPYWP